MSGLFQAALSFFTPKSDQGSIIEAVNECGEKRYIEMEIERNYQLERQKDLEILLTKCKRLLSFVEARNYNGSFNKMSIFIDKVRIAKYRGDDITNLFREFEDIENNIKRRSQSFNNLSQMRMIG